MPRGWEGNRRSGVALAMCHVLSGLSVAKEKAPCLCRLCDGVFTIYLYLVLTDISTRPCLQRWFSNEAGWLASRNHSPCLIPGCHGCTSVFYIKHQPIQLRFHSFRLFPGEFVDIRQGTMASDRLIGRFTSNHRPGRVVEVSGSRIFVSFSAVGGSLGFNFTFQPKGEF